MLSPRMQRVVDQSQILDLTPQASQSMFNNQPNSYVIPEISSGLFMDQAKSYL